MAGHVVADHVLDRPRLLSGLRSLTIDEFVFCNRYDQDGNVLVRAVENRPVYVKEWHQALLEPQQSCISDELIKSRGRVACGKTYKLFEMKKFLANVSCEMLNAYPDRRKLATQCISVIAFSKSRSSCELLQQPVWIMVINIVALEMLKSDTALGELRSLNDYNLLAPHSA